MPYIPPTRSPPVTELEIAPDASDLNLGSVIIHRAARPYVAEWFNDLKQAGDTPLRFLLRKVYAEALRHRQAKLTNANGSPGPVNPDGSPVSLDSHADQRVDYTVYLGNEQARLAATIEGILP